MDNRLLNLLLLHIYIQMLGILKASHEVPRFLRTQENMASINVLERLAVPFSPLLQLPILVSSLFLLFVTVSAVMFSRKARYAPGPSALPLIGHTFSIPMEKPWLYFEQLGGRYGSLSFISLSFPVPYLSTMLS